MTTRGRDLDCRSNAGSRRFIFGVSGHRDLVSADVPQLRGQIQTLFSRFRAAYPDVSFQLLSPLAEGADRLAARTADARARANPHPNAHAKRQSAAHGDADPKPYSDFSDASSREHHASTRLHAVIEPAEEVRAGLTRGSRAGDRATNGSPSHSDNIASVRVLSHASWRSWCIGCTVGCGPSRTSSTLVGRPGM